MPIEFRCIQCDKLLRTGDDTAGRQAQCPECGALSKVPMPVAAMGSPPPLAPLQGETSAALGSPFGSGLTPGAEAFGVLPAQRVSGPATALIVTAILGMILQVLGILGNLVLMAVDGGVNAAARNAEEFPMLLGGGVNLAMGVFGLAIGVVVLVGAMKMKKLESYSFAMTSAIIAMIPCFSPCCLLGLPFGIWALAVLNDSSVKAAFRS